MEPLISIKCIPFQYDMVVNDARLEMKTPMPQHRLTRQTGGLNVDYTPGQIKIDTTAARQSMELKGVLLASKEAGQRGMDAARQAAGQFAQEGNRMMDSRNKNVFGEIAVERTKSSLDTMLGFLPSAKADISFDPHELQMRYEMDKLQFDWRTSSKAEMNFTPASIEFKVKDYAKVLIEYIGGPIYVPKSANPDYVPPPGMDVKG